MNASVERVWAVLAELIEAALLSDDAEGRSCRETARSRLARLGRDPPDPASLRMDGAWTLAIRAAEAPEMAPREGRASPTLPLECPSTLAEMLSPGFDVDRAVDGSRKSASTG